MMDHSCRLRPLKISCLFAKGLAETDNLYNMMGSTFMIGLAAVTSQSDPLCTEALLNR